MVFQQNSSRLIKNAMRWTTGWNFMRRIDASSLSSKRLQHYDRWKSNARLSTSTTLWSSGWLANKRIVASDRRCNDGKQADICRRRMTTFVCFVLLLFLCIVFMSFSFICFYQFFLSIVSLKCIIFIKFNLKLDNYGKGTLSRAPSMPRTLPTVCLEKSFKVLKIAYFGSILGN